MNNAEKKKPNQKNSPIEADANKAVSPVSDKDKQKLVHQYRQRAEEGAVEGDAPIGQGADWSDYDLGKNWTDFDNKHRRRQSVTEGSANGDYLAPAQTYSPNQEFQAYQGPTASDLKQAVDAMTNDTMVQLSAYRNHVNPDYNINANPLYGYGQSEKDFYSQYGAPVNWPENYRPISAYLEDVDPSILSWIENSGAAETEQGQADLSRAFNLMENMNAYDREQELLRYAQNVRDRNLYGSALMDLQENLQPQNNNRSLVQDAIRWANAQENIDRLARSARKRNITGSGTIGW